MDRNKIFVIGAARSGTKILRDLLASSDKISAVPYDINYIWRYGNEKLSHDELKEENYSEKNHDKIDKYLESFRKNNESFIIEKTVSNTIRIPYILKHYPYAKFIFLYRNGYDVVESVIRQWKSKNDKTYLSEKIKTVPFSILLNYGLKYLFRSFKRGTNDYYWGVNYPGLRSDLKDGDITKVVATQWKYCMDKMIKDKNLIPSENLVEIHYEKLVNNPKEELCKIDKFFNDYSILENIDLGMIKKGNIGKSNNKLSDNQSKKIDSIISNTFKSIQI